MITDWFREYIDSNPYTAPAIPFSGFLEQKIKAIPNQEVISFPAFPEVVFHDNSSLYFHIAYIWFNLFLKEHDGDIIDIQTHGMANGNTKVVVVYKAMED